jgi:hypothetical protein
MNSLYDTNSQSGHPGEQTLWRTRKGNRAERVAAERQARPPGRKRRRVLARWRYGLRDLIEGDGQGAGPVAITRSSQGRVGR